MTTSLRNVAEVALNEQLGRMPDSWLVNQIIRCDVLREEMEDLFQHDIFVAVREALTEEAKCPYCSVVMRTGTVDAFHDEYAVVECGCCGLDFRVYPDQPEGVRNE